MYVWPQKAVVGKCDLAHFKPLQICSPAVCPSYCDMEQFFMQAVAYEVLSAVHQRNVTAPMFCGKMLQGAFDLHPASPDVTRLKLSVTATILIFCNINTVEQNDQHCVMRLCQRLYASLHLHTLAMSIIITTSAARTTGILLT